MRHWADGSERSEELLEASGGLWAWGRRLEKPRVHTRAGRPPVGDRHEAALARPSWLPWQAWGRPAGSGASSSKPRSPFHGRAPCNALPGDGPWALSPRASGSSARSFHPAWCPQELAAQGDSW